MTRFEEARESVMSMSIMVAFCIAAYLEANGTAKFSDEQLKEFMDITSDDIAIWLKEEADVKGV